MGEGAGLSVKKYECVKPESGKGPEQCPKWGDHCKYAVGGGKNGGIVYSLTAKGGNLVLALGKLKKGMPAKIATCGKDGTKPAAVAGCKDNLSRFEMKPMFLTEAGKMAVGCAPYTHSNTVKPKPAATEADAMALCAKQGSCLAYNWAAKDAKCPTTPPCQGKYKGFAWACTALHEVHAQQAGWSLGVRAGKLEPFVEEEERYM